MINLGKGPTKSNETHEADIIIEEFMNGPYFGDERHITCYTLPKLDLQTVGTTEYVRGGFSQCDKILMIKRIKASYDRIGIDTLDHEEETANALGYPTIQEQQTEIDKVIIYDFKHSFVGWSANLQLEHKDFLTTKSSMAKGKYVFLFVTRLKE